MPDLIPDRTRFIGGTDMAAILGVGDYGRTPLSVYLSKIGASTEVMDPEKKKFLERRKRWEGPIVEMLREEFDGEIVAVNRRYVDDQHDFLSCEIDFEWRDSDGSIQNGEIKTVSPFNFGESNGWGEPGTGDIPIQYAAQVMHGLGIAKRRVTIVAAMIGLDNMSFYHVERDEETIEAMRQKAIDFWFKHVLARDPPEPSNMEDLMRLFARWKGVQVEANDEIVAKVKKLKAIKDSLSTMSREADEVEFEICDYMRQAFGIEDKETEPSEDKTMLLYKGEKILTWNSQRRSFLQQKELAKVHPDLAKEFSKESAFRVLRLSK